MLTAVSLASHDNTYFNSSVTTPLLYNSYLHNDSSSFVSFLYNLTTQDILVSLMMFQFTFLNILITNIFHLTDASLWSSLTAVTSDQ